MSRQIGFWSVFALVTGSQIGSGVFMSPATLAPYGAYGLLGWLFSGIGALALAFVFAELCSRFPKTGGPHVYVQQAFGPIAAFFAGWTYWIVSFISTTAVIVTSIGYLSPLLPIQPGLHLSLELFLLCAIVLLNLKGVKAAGNAEFFLTLLKFIPLFVLPALAFFYFDPSNLIMSQASQDMPFTHLLGHVTILTMWGFIGVESATTAAGSVIDPAKTIPRAILLGTIVVALVYVFSSIGIMGLIPGPELMGSNAPYVDAAQKLGQGGHWHLVISLIASIVCIGTLNAWVLTSGQIALGLAEDGFLPSAFAKINRSGAPYLGLLCSSLGIVPLLVLTSSASLAEQITEIIDISVISFLFVYLLCSLGLLKILRREKYLKINIPTISACVSIMFCIFVISQTPLMTLVISSLFTLSGLPMFLGFYLRTQLKRDA